MGLGSCFHGICQESETYDHQTIFNLLRWLPQQFFGMNATKDQFCGYIAAMFQCGLSLGNDPEMFSPFHFSMHVLLNIAEVHLSSFMHSFFANYPRA